VVCEFCTVRYNSCDMRSGSLLLSHGAWYLKLYVGGKQRAYRLGPRRQFDSKREVRLAADRKMLELRLVDAGSAGRITLETFIRLWYLKLQRERLRPSTVDEYEGMWRRYIEGRTEAKRPLTEYRTHHVQELLGGIATDNNLSRETLKHIKAFLSGVFRHAVAAGLREGNPVHETLLPKSNKPQRPTGVYTLAEIDEMLQRLEGPPRAAVAIAAYAGLRRSEIAGLHWSDYDGESLNIERTRWRNQINPPKSEASHSWVPVIPALKAVLEAYRNEPPERKPRGDYNEDAMFKVNLYDMGRATIKPLVKEWRGWHALRRGLASNLFELGADDLTVMRILRHASVTVTRRHYIKVRDPKMTAAMASLESAVTRNVQGAVGNEPSVLTK
jgi:integrase